MKKRLCFTVVPKDATFIEFPQHGVLSCGLWSNNDNEQECEQEAKESEHTTFVLKRALRGAPPRLGPPELCEPVKGMSTEPVCTGHKELTPREGTP